MDYIIIGGFIVGGIILSCMFNYFRRKKVAAVAEELGLEFLPKVDLIDELVGCELFANKGHGKKCFNCFGGDADGVDFKVFEYKYTIGMGKRQKVHSQTVAYIKLEHLVLPNFQVTAKNFFSKLFNKPLNRFEVNDEDFSKKFWTCSTEVPKAMSLFNTEVKNLLLEKNCSVESNNGRLLIYRHGTTVGHTKLKQFLTTSLQLMMELEDATQNPVNPLLGNIPVVGAVVNNPVGMQLN